MTKGRGEWKEWSIMVYLAGGRDVSDAARESLLRMKQVGSTENIHVVAQFDSGTEGTFTRRYYLTHLESAGEIESLLKQEPYEVPPDINLFNSTVKALSTFNSQSLMEALSADQRRSLREKLQITEISEALRRDPTRIKSLILNCILDADLDEDDGDQGQTNAGNPKVLGGFLEWAIGNYPAGKKMLIIWGHGSGLSVAWDFPVPGLDAAQGVQQSGSRPLAGVPSSRLPDSLTGAELRTAFHLVEEAAEGRRSLTTASSSENDQAKHNPNKIDIVGFNSCSLGTIEVYHELSGLVDFGVASEGFTPKASWPYHEILKALNATPCMKAEEFAQTIVTKHIEFYAGSVGEPKLRTRGLGTGNLDFTKAGPDLDFVKAGPDLDFVKAGPDLDFVKAGPDLGPREAPKRRGIDLSACDLSKSQAVVDAMARLVSLLKLEEPQVFGAVLAAHSVGQSYFNQDFTDLHDFCRALNGFSLDAPIRTACDNVMGAVKSMCPNPQNRGESQNSNGVSIFFPWGEWGNKDVLRKYNGLKFLEVTKWNVFLENYRDLVRQFETAPAIAAKARGVAG